MLDRIKFWLLLGLLASNLAVGLLSLRFLNTISDRYVGTYDRSVPFLNHLRLLTRELSQVQRLARRVVDPKSEPAWAQLVQQLDDTSNRARLHAGEIGSMELIRTTRFAPLLVQEGRAYDQSVDKFLAAIHEKRFEEASRYNTDTLRPEYDEFMRLLDDVGDHVQQQGADIRTHYEQDSRLFSGFMLAFAGWPLVALALTLAFVFLLILALLISVFAPGLLWRKSVPTPKG
jgi:hypothetical protein